MSKIEDIREMHTKFGVYTWIVNNPDKLQKLMDLRMMMLTEEYRETVAAVEAGDAEEVVDGLIDIIVIALGTLDICNVDPTVAWNRVMAANLTKDVGVKEGRPNPLGLPDLIKPEGWQAPSHKDNHGRIAEFLKDPSE